LHYSGASPSIEVAEQLRAEHSVLVVPGQHFGMDGYLRLAFGMSPQELSEALDRVRRVLP
jgi:aspartate/methionine/tyrosine aminotransferase